MGIKLYARYTSALSILISLLVGDSCTAYAQAIPAPKNLWLCLTEPSLQIEPSDTKWLQSQESDAFLDKIHPLSKRVKGVIIPVFSEGRAYYQTQVQPFANRNASAALDEKRLLLFISHAKKKQIPIYLSVNLLDWQKNTSGLALTNSSLFLSHPQWQEIRQPGVQPQVAGSFYASPWHPEVRKYLNQLLSEIGKKFPTADGVLFNARLSDREILGFSDAARLASIRDLGFDPFDLNLQNRADDQNNDLVKQWRQWKCSSIRDFVKELRVTYTKSHPRGSVIAFGLADYYTRQEFNDLRTSQDWLSWFQDKAVDKILMEGRWTPRYGDSISLNTFLDTLPKAENIIPVSAGSHLVKASDFVRDWSFLKTRADNIPEMAFSASSDADIQAILRLGTGKEKIVPPLPPGVGEPLPEVALLKSGGKYWRTRDLRGKVALALLLNPESLQNSAQVISTYAKHQNKNLSFVCVSRNPAQTKKMVPLSLLDAKGELLSYYDKKPRLVVVDRDGWVRKDIKLADAKSLDLSLQKLAEPTPQLAVGRKAPDFSLQDTNGVVRRLSDLYGKSNLILTFFPKCFTGGCSNHLKSLRDKEKQFSLSDTKIWAVSVDPADTQIAFARSLNVSFPLLSDTGRHLCLLYQSIQGIDDLSFRRSVLIDKKGVVRFIDADIDVENHGSDMLNRMHKLGLLK